MSECREGTMLVWEGLGDLPYGFVVWVTRYVRGRKKLTYKMYLSTFPVSSSSLVRATSYGKCTPSRYIWKKSVTCELLPHHTRNRTKGLT